MHPYYEELHKYLKSIKWDVPDAVIIHMIKNGADNTHTLLKTAFPVQTTYHGWSHWEYRRRYNLLYENLIRLQNEGKIYRVRTLRNAIIWGVEE